MPFLPGFLVGAVLNRVSSYIDEEICPVEKTDFKVKKLKPIACVDRIECPILFIASKHDQMVNIEHTLRLYKAANCLKKLITVPGYSLHNIEIITLLELMI